MKRIKVVAIIAAVVLFSFSIWAADEKKAPAKTSSKAKTETKTETKTEAKTEAKTETKAAAKTEAKTEFKTDLDKLSYSIGANIGNNMKNMKKLDIEINKVLFLKGFEDSYNSNPFALTEQEMTQILTDFGSKIEEKQTARLKEVTEKNLAEAKAFLEKNGKEKGVKTLPSGLQYIVVKEGKGASPKDSDSVKVNYVGTFLDGMEFDSSAKHGGAAQFPVNGVIAGWTEALKLMKVGSKWKIFVPPDLAYGERGRQGVPPNTLLIFEMELLGIPPAPAAPKAEPSPEKPIK